MAKLCCLLLVVVAMTGLLQEAVAAELPSTPPAKIISMESEGPEGPEFKFKFEADNGIKEERDGKEGPEGTSVMKGKYIYVMEDGSIVEVEYTADENGFVAKSPVLPTPHPLPAHAIAQIKFAKENPES